MEENMRLKEERIKTQKSGFREKQSQKYILVFTNFMVESWWALSAQAAQRFCSFPGHPGMRLHSKFPLVTTQWKGGTAEPKWVKPRVYLPLQATGQEAWTGFFFQPTPVFAPPGMLSSVGCRLLSIFAFPMIHHQILHKSTERKQKMGDYL